MQQMTKRLFGAGCAIFLALPAYAEENVTAYPEPMFRRVGVPGPDHQGPRINIWIEPQAETAEPEPETEMTATPEISGSSAAGWFWDEVPSGLDRTGRMQAAMARIAAAPEVDALPIARLADLHAMAADHGRAILAATIGTDVSPALALAVIAVESAGRADAVSGAGAQGLMQLIPATADRFDVADPFDPAQNIAGGVAYLDWLLGEFGQDPILALAGYNAGEGAVWSNGGVPDYRETRDYVPKVLATWEVVRGLCATPPQFISDGCVFVPLAEG